MLIILSGLPGTGKTTIARHLAARMDATHIRVDTIEQALRSSDTLKDDVGPAGYAIAYAVSQDNLRLGRTIIADSVNPLQITRDAWRSVARRSLSASVEIEVICSDRDEHRRRVETRLSDIEGLKQPTWQDVVDRRYDSWDHTPIVVDTALADADNIVTDLIAGIRQAQVRLRLKNTTTG